MSASDTARLWVIDAAGQRGWDETRERWLERGAKELGIEFRFAKKLFYREPHRLDADVYLGMQLKLEKLKSSAKTRRERLNGISRNLGSAADLASRAHRQAGQPGDGPSRASRSKSGGSEGRGREGRA